MKILFVVPTDQAVGGVSYVVGNLARHLRKKGHTVLFLCPSDTVLMKPRVMASGFPGFELRMQPPRTARHPFLSVWAFGLLFPLTLYQLIRFIKRSHIDVINIHYPLDNFFYFAVCRRVLGVVLVSSIHGADIFPLGKLQVAHARATRFLLSSSDLIVAPSRRFREDFLSSFPQLARKAIVIHNGVNPDELKAQASATAPQLRAATVLCVSTYKEQKAIDVLVRAFKVTLEAVPSAKLVIAGGGPLRGQMEALAASLGIRERIDFLGLQERDRVARLLNQCEVFVLPSRFETFGVAILEAMACRKPVVATTAGGIPEIIENGKNGLLVEPDNPSALAEALIALLKNSSLRFTLSNRAHETVNGRFSCEVMGSSYERAFVELLTARQKSDSEPTLSCDVAAGR